MYVCCIKKNMSSHSRYYKTYGQLAPSENKQTTSQSSRVIVAENPAAVDKLLQVAPLCVIDIFGSWCGPCMKFKPIFEELSLTNQSVEFVSIDIDNPAFNGSQYTSDVKGVPYFKLYSNGKLINEIKGGNRLELEGTITTLSNQKQQSLPLKY